MKKIIKIALIGLLLITAACGALVMNDNQEGKNKEESIFQLISKVIQTYHYNQIDTDNTFSEKAFDQFVDMIDHGKRFLLQEDYDNLLRYKTQMDDAFNDATLEAFEAYNKVMPEREEYVAKVVEKLLKKPIDLHKTGELQLEGDSLAFCASKKELKKRWKDYLTYAVMDKMYQIQKRNESDSAKEVMSTKDLEKKAREDVLDKHKDWFNRLSKLERNDRFTVFTNAILSVYDPHTTYFPPKQKEDFDIGFSGKLEGIGATLTTKDGYIKVSKIIAGSASWRQGDLEAGDLILEVAQAEEEPVDVFDMRLDKAVRLIRGPKGSEVRLTVKKVDGEIMVIPIIRDVVVIEETYAKSLVLQEKEDSVKYGYISLESFYADFNDASGRRCSRDVLMEIQALKSSGVQGLILDLRNNGGGSLSDAVDMVGHFIKDGPVVQVDGVDQAPEVYPDEDSRIHFSAPLVVLVNNFSASASEIFAAAIQDYERGVIVGINTFGKGTVQRFLDLDRLATSTQAKDYMPTGSVKLTMAKFYRINGGATQLKGVQPDIVLPEAYMNVEIGEQEYDFALPWTSIPAARYDKVGYSFDLNALKANSNSRVDTSAYFEKVEKQSNHIQSVRNNSTYPLNFDSFKAYKASIQKKNEAFEFDLKSIKDWSVRLNNTDAEKATQDTVLQERFSDFQKKVEKDRYIREALNIIQEM